MNYSPVIHDNARELYFQGFTTAEIVKKLKITAKAVDQWIIDGQWETMLRDRTRSEVHKRGDVIIAQEQTAIVERKVRQVQKFDRHIEKHLDKRSLNARNLVNLAKAASAVSTMTDNMLGLKKAASLNVFVQFNMRPARIQDAIDQGFIDITEVPEAERLVLPLPSIVRVKDALAEPSTGKG